MRVVDNPAVPDIMRLYQRTAGLPLAEALALETEHTSRRSFDPVAFEREGRRVSANKHDGRFSSSDPGNGDVGQEV
jgi:hypothetical protein